MGLSTTHDAFRGAYSAFNRFRKKVADAIGGSFAPHDNPELDPKYWYWWAGEGEKNPFGYSKETHPGLYEFFMHEDCEGEISPEKCILVADELEALLPNIARIDDGGGGHIEYAGGYVAVTKRFIAGCRRAAAAGEPLIFH